MLQNRFLKNTFIICAILISACSGHKQHKRKIISRFPDGTIKQENEYLNKDSTRYISYLDSSNGQLLGIFTFHGNLMDGQSSIYFPNGKLRQLEFVKNGKNNGASYAYYQNGQLKQILQYSNGKNEGDGVQYYPNGKIKNIEYFKNDSLNGYSIQFYPNGKVGIFDNYKDGSLNGYWISYFENGQIRSSENYDMGKRNGRIIFFYPTGQIHQYALFHEDKSIWYLEYDKNGKLIKYPKQWSRKDFVNHLLNDK